MEINHAIVTRARFKDKNLRNKYYKISKEILIPSLKNQVEKNFTWVLFILKEDVNYTRDFFEIDFVPVFNIDHFTECMQKHKFKIQTRHDIDDWMSPWYVKEIHKIYKQNYSNFDKFIIHAQPTKYLYHAKQENIMGQYHDERTSMFTTLCQQICTNHILEKTHGWMWEIAPKVFKIPEGYVKWVIHGDNISCQKK